MGSAIKKKTRYIVLLVVVILLLILLLCNLIIEKAARGKTFDQVDAIPKNKVGLVLGTARMLVEGGINPFYEHRIQATITLYKAGKIDFVLVSGDNGSIYYNEPTTFKKDLIRGGIPAEKIFLDYAGFRTLDSMVRARTIFGLDSVTVISQEFHNERAIYLASKKGLTAIGFNAPDVAGQHGRSVHLREHFARVKVFMDLLMNIQPRFYGDTIEIR